MEKDVSASLTWILYRYALLNLFSDGLQVL